MVIVSARLPDMAAVEFCSMLRMNRDLRSTKVLMITEELEAGGELSKTQLDGHLIAPVDPEQLSRTVGALLALAVRETPRVEVELLAQVSGIADGDPDRAIFVNVVDLSEGGARIEAETHLKVGASGSIWFYLPGFRDKLTLPFTVRGIVDEFALHYGVEFVAVGPFASKVLREFVEARMAKAATTPGEETVAETLDDWEVDL